MEVLKRAKEKFQEYLKEKAPKAEIDKTSIEIKGIKYGILGADLLTISNIGESIINYKIERPKVNWITIIQMSGVLSPGESMEVPISILVTAEEAQALHSDPNYLKTNVEIKITDGQIFNIEVIGNYIKSCFGASLELLNSVYEGFSTLDLNLTAKELINKHSRRLVIPKEIFELTRWIMSNGARTEKLFVFAGNDADKRKVRECLDTNKEINKDIDPYSVADTLIELLESIRNIIPIEIITDTIKEYEQVGDTDNKICDLFLMKLAPDVSTLVVYMVSFYKQLLEYADYNNLSVEVVVRVLASCLVRIDSSTWDQQYEQEESTERKIRIAQIAIKRKLRYQGIFALMLI